MRLRRVAVLGGGPGGLYVARLLKLANPGGQVDVYEQGVPGKTFGFGVGLAAGTQRNLRAADAPTLDEVLSRGWPHDMSMRVGGQVAQLPNNNLRAIGRATLLTVLQQHAASAGVDLHFGARASVSDVDADLIVAADGAGSAARSSCAGDLGVRIDNSPGLYLWCGTDFALDSAVFTPVTTVHGTFVTHAYPYAADRSTFLIETGEQTWRRAGFDATSDTTPFDESDQRSLAYLQEAFRETLRGHALIGNRTRWLRFRTVRCDRWHRGRLVLLGDAAHTAHYSIGSGTKLAMEDAIALVAALGAAVTLEQALQAYEAERRPAVDHLQAVAARSQRWWDSFPKRMHLPVDQLLVSYMTRAGKVSLPRFAESTPHVVQRSLAGYSGTGDVPGGDIVDWVIRQPLRLDHAVLPDRTSRPGGIIADIEVTEPDAWGTKADGLADQAAGQLADGAAAVRLTGPDDRDAVLDRLDLAERLRLQLGTVVIVRAPERYREDLAAGLVSARADLIDTEAGGFS
ncbi:MAG: anthraniloyl-CoA monooxygenase [Pseudonocardiales bacterium]|jgi:anthraniloyl-CoA monooxygenase|nr:anthraniloyl-CoA monooxygenase [Pseudonocardiales bacterium]